MNLRKHVPNSITMLNLSFGFAALLLNDPFISPLLILAAGVADLFDGLMARWLNVKSDLGAQLDSLADLVSFGVAPAYLYYHHVMEAGFISMVVICLVPVFAAVRLAIFNLDDSQQTHFKGLPSPANGFFFAFLVFGWDFYADYLDNIWILSLIPIVFSLFMILPVKMFSLKGIRSKQKTEKIFLLILLAVGIFFLFWLQLKGIPIVVLAYLILSWIHLLVGPGPRDY